MPPSAWRQGLGFLDQLVIRKKFLGGRNFRELHGVSLVPRPYLHGIIQEGPGNQTSIVFDCENRENFCLMKISTSWKFLTIHMVFLFTIFRRTMMRSNDYLIILELRSQVTIIFAKMLATLWRQPDLPDLLLRPWTKAEPKNQCKYRGQEIPNTTFKAQ